MSKNIIKICCIYIGILLGYLNPLISYVGLLRLYIYSGYKKRCFTSVGKDVLISPYCKRIEGGIIGNRCTFGRNLWLSSIPNSSSLPNISKIQIGNDCKFGDNNHIAAYHKIIIGNGVLTGQYVLIEDHSHGTTAGPHEDLIPAKRNLYSKGAIIIGDNVWIGDKVAICPGVSIGEGVIIGANSVVTHDLPPFTVVAGVPAKIIRRRD